MRTLTVLAALALGCATPASAQIAPDFTTGKGIASACGSTDAPVRNFCTGMIFGAVGIARTYGTMRVDQEPVLRDPGRVICPPVNFDVAEVRDAFVTWINSTQGAEQLTYPGVLFFGLSQLFPCGVQAPTLAPPTVAPPAPLPPILTPQAR